MQFNHYKWLEIHLPAFLEACNVRGGWGGNAGIITAHGDKFYCYRSDFEAANIHFAHGVAIGLLSYCHPFSSESRDTENGWVAVEEWIIENKNRFIHLLPKIDENDPDYVKYCSKF